MTSATTAPSRAEVDGAIKDLMEHNFESGAGRKVVGGEELRQLKLALGDVLDRLFAALSAAAGVLMGGERTFFLARAEVDLAITNLLRHHFMLGAKAAVPDSEEHRQLQRALDEMLDRIFSGIEQARTTEGGEPSC